MTTGIVLIAIVVVLGVVVWWGNKRAKDILDDTSDLEGYKPLKFNRIVPRIPWK